MQNPRKEERVEIRFEENVGVALCALMLEISRADDEFSDAERSQILKILRKEYGLHSDEAESLVGNAAGKLDESLDLWHFTREINRSLSKDQKIQIVKQLWKIIYTDDHLDGHEDYLIHKLVELLQLEHRDLIQAKISILEENRTSRKKKLI